MVTIALVGELPVVVFVVAEVSRGLEVLAPVNDTAPTAPFVEPEKLTVILFAPVEGFARYQIDDPCVLFEVLVALVIATLL